MVLGQASCDNSLNILLPECRHANARPEPPLILTSLPLIPGVRHGPYEADSAGAGIGL